MTPRIHEAVHVPMLFRKRPAVVKAWRFTRHDDIELAHWCKGDLITTVDPETSEVTHAQLDVRTQRGVVSALIGDWIIQDWAGEYYPCTADVFAATYEPLVAH